MPKRVNNTATSSSLNGAAKRSKVEGKRANKESKMDKRLVSIMDVLKTHESPIVNGMLCSCVADAFPLDKAERHFAEETTGGMIETTIESIRLDKETKENESMRQQTQFTDEISNFRLEYGQLSVNLTEKLNMIDTANMEVAQKTGTLKEYQTQKKSNTKQGKQLHGDYDRKKTEIEKAEEDYAKIQILKNHHHPQPVQQSKSDSEAADAEPDNMMQENPDIPTEVEPTSITNKEKKKFTSILLSLMTDMGCEDAMIAFAPHAFSKPPQDRQTFENLGIDQFEQTYTTFLAGKNTELGDFEPKFNALRQAEEENETNVENATEELGVAQTRLDLLIEEKKTLDDKCEEMSCEIEEKSLDLVAVNIDIESHQQEKTAAEEALHAIKLLTGRVTSDMGNVNLDSDFMVSSDNQDDEPVSASVQQSSIDLGLL